VTARKSRVRDSLASNARSPRLRRPGQRPPAPKIAVLRPSAMLRNDYCSQISDLTRLDARNRRTSLRSHCALEPCWKRRDFAFRAGKRDVTPCFERGSAQEQWRRPAIRHGWPRRCLGPMTTSASRTSARSQSAVRTLSAYRRVVRWDLLVGLTWANRKQAHSNPSWFKRDDAAVLQGVDELGQVREQRSCQCVRFPAALAAKLDDGGLSRRSHGEQRSEISIRRYEDSMLDGSESEDRIVVGVLQSYRANVDCIMTGLLQESDEHGRKSVVDQKLHSPAARGSARSRTASAANSSASRTSSDSRSGYSARMASVVCPSATRATTVATGIRRPRRHGTPPIWRGLVVILLNSILTV
jgi:hypothetical protein